MQTAPSRISGYRGRVRTGCLTCRSRKVKCDEAKPICNNCARLNRDCVYRPRKRVEIASLNKSSGVAEVNPIQSRDSGAFSSQVSPSPLFEEQHSLLAASFRLNAIQDPFSPADSSLVDVISRLENALHRQNDNAIPSDGDFDAAVSPSTLISRDIKLTTTMDILTAREAPLQPSFSFFVDSVDCPAITPFDAVSWQRMKTDMVKLGMFNAAVASAIIALSALYKGQLYRLPLSKAISLYQSARGSLEKNLNDRTQDFDAILTATFLLCLFEFVHYETVPFMKEPSEVFMKRLGDWAQRRSSHSELSSRIVVWLRLLQAITTRGGGMGLISESVCSLFPSGEAGITNLRPHSSHHTDASTQIYEMLSTPILDFYFQLEKISGDIAKLSHYHRSRTTGVDQEEVVQRIGHIKARLHTLWESRPATQRQTPEDLRSHLAPKIANPIITLIGLVTAAYHAEFVEIDRVLGDPVSETADSKQAMRSIRSIIDGDFNTYNSDSGKLNPGYLRPLFLYAIECMDRGENAWAVERLERIQDPICRSEFFAAFGKALSDAQLWKERRVTSKYFCIWHFGFAPPFM